MITIRSNKEEEVKFSNAVLLNVWAIENGKSMGTKVKASNFGFAKVEKVKRQTEKGKREGGRNYKGQSGRISKDGKNGYFDVDSRGRLICV